MSTPHEQPPNENDPADASQAGSRDSQASRTTPEDSPAQNEPTLPESPTDDPVAASHVDGDERQDDDELPEIEPLTPELVEDEAIRGDFMIRWAVVMLAFLLASTEIAETVTLLHVKTGRYMASHGILPPRTDVFSYTAADRSWINLSWLFDLLAAGVHGATGFVGLTLVKALVAAFVFAVIVHTSRRGVSTWWGSVAAALALLVCAPQFTVRGELITLAGIALTLWLLTGWKQRGNNKLLWVLVPTFFLWSNLSSGMFFGLALLLLYALGETVGRILGHAGSTGTGPTGIGREKLLWKVVGLCFVAAVLNPFGWNALLAPLRLYGVEYPAFRSYYHSFTLNSSANFIPVDVLQYFPMTHGLFWRALNVHAVAGLLLVLAAGVSFVLNRTRLPISHLFVFIGFLGFAAAGSHELAVLGVISCVLATLNAQEWYRVRFRQTYSVEMSELLFSRGGRAVTVIALAAMAYLSISGNLFHSARRQIGFGLHASIGSTIQAMQEELDDSFDDKPFNFRIEQGDMLIWADQRVFIDSRLAIYRAAGQEDLVKLHSETRDVLRESDTSKETLGSNPADRLRKHNERRRIWRETFDRFEVTHVLPRMGCGSDADYRTFGDLMKRPLEWQMTHLGAATAGFYRTDLRNNRKLSDYLKTHKIDLVGSAFRSEAVEIEERAVWARPDSIYEKYLSLSRGPMPNSVRQARHYTKVMQFQRSANPETMMALIYLVIRKANEGLAENPHNTDGYIILGDMYEILNRLENQISGGPLGAPVERRHYQTIHAFNQALIINPDDLKTHATLMQLYVGTGKVDLAMRELDEFTKLVVTQVGDPEKRREQLLKNQRLQEGLTKRVNLVKENISQIQKYSKQNISPLDAAGLAKNNGCVLYALELLEGDPEFLKENITAQVFQSTLLIEAGRAEEATVVLRDVQIAVGNSPYTLWRSPRAIAGLANGDYTNAVSLWTSDANDADQKRLSGLMDTLPMVAPLRLSRIDSADQLRWPILHTRAAYDSLGQFSRQTADRLFQVALCHLETGHNQNAIDVFRRILKIKPDTRYRRLIAFYLGALTGEKLDVRPSFDWIPIEPDMFATEPAG